MESAKKRERFLQLYRQQDEKMQILTEKNLGFNLFWTQPLLYRCKRSSTEQGSHLWDAGQLWDLSILV